MLVKIEEIQGNGLERTEPINSKVLHAALQEAGGMSLINASPLEAHFKKVSNRVFVRGSFSVDVGVPCKRCTDDVAEHLDVNFNLRMVHEPLAQRPDEHATPEHESKHARKRREKKEDDGQAELAASFELDEIDAEPFDGKTIDLDPVVREQVLLALPVTVVCKEDCKGLCAECGQNLNEQDCGHGKLKEVDVRLAKLKDIKLN